MAEHENAVATTEFQDAQARYAEACGDLVTSLKYQLWLEESSLETLVEAEEDPQDRKRLIVGLKCAGLISDAVASFAIGYRWPLRAA
jgi:hypothetical protein